MLSEYTMIELIRELYPISFITLIVFMSGFIKSAPFLYMYVKYLERQIGKLQERLDKSLN